MFAAGPSMPSRWALLDIGGNRRNLDSFVQVRGRTPIAHPQVVIVCLAGVMQSDQLPFVVEDWASGTSVVGIGYVVQQSARIPQHLVVVKDDLLGATVRMLNNVRERARMNDVRGPFERHGAEFGRSSRLNGDESVVEAAVVGAGHEEFVRQQTKFHIRLCLAFIANQKVKLTNRLACDFHGVQHMVIGEQEFGANDKSGAFPALCVVLAFVVDTFRDHDPAHRQGAPVPGAQEDRGKEIGLSDNDLRQRFGLARRNEFAGDGIAHVISKGVTRV
jgi:hypothetical protein